MNNYAIMSTDFAQLEGKPFIGIEDASKVENCLPHCEKIFADLGLNDEQERRLAFRQLQEAALIW